MVYSLVHKLRDNTVKMAYSPNWSTNFAIFVKIPADYSTKIEKLILIFLWNQESQNRQTILRKKNKAEELTLLNFSQYIAVRVIKAMDSAIRINIEVNEIELRVFGALIVTFQKGSKTNGGKNNIFN